MNAPVEPVGAAVVRVVDVEVEGDAIVRNASLALRSLVSMVSSLVAVVLGVVVVFLIARNVWSVALPLGGPGVLAVLFFPVVVMMVCRSVRQALDFNAPTRHALDVLVWILCLQPLLVLLLSIGPRHAPRWELLNTAISLLLVPVVVSRLRSVGLRPRHVSLGPAVALWTVSLIAELVLTLAA